MERRPGFPKPNSQEIAYTFATHLSRVKIVRKVARKYARDYDTDISRRKLRKQASAFLQASRDGSHEGVVLEEKEKEKITRLHQEISRREREHLEKKRGNFPTIERASLLFKAKLKRINGLSEDERMQMYKEAGYTDEEIDGITGKKIASSLAVTAGLTAVSEGVRVGGTVYDQLIPLAENLPGKAGAAVSVAAYTASYIIFTLENLRLTKKTGISSNASVTGLYAMGNRLLPNKARDTIAVGVPVAADALLHSAAYTAVIGGVTGDPTKIVAGNLTSIGLTLAFAGGSEVWLRRKMRKDKKTKKE